MVKLCYTDQEGKPQISSEDVAPCEFCLREGVHDLHPLSKLVHYATKEFWEGGHHVVHDYYVCARHLESSASSGVQAGTNRGEVRAEGPSETASAERPRRGASSEGEPNE